MPESQRCTACGGFGVIESPIGLVPCSCQPDERRWEAARIPIRFFSAPVSLLPGEEIQLSKYLWGPPGHGKTTIAVGFLKRWSRRRLGGVFVDLSEHERKRKLAIDTGEDLDEAVLSAAFLVADDFLRQPRITDYWRTFLESLVLKRYNEKRPTVWTSNLSLEQVEGVLGEHVASRLAEMCAERIERVESKNWRLA